MKDSRSRANRSRVSAVLVAVLVVGLVSVATPAQAAVNFSLRPLSWDVVGLDSNKVTDGPNVYEVGARACNTGGTTASTVRATLVWDGDGVSMQAPKIVTLPTAQNEVKTLTLSGGAAGDILMLEESGYSSPLTMPVGGFASVTAAQVQAAILAFPNFAGGTVGVTKAGNVYTITFSGALGNQDIPSITAHQAANEVDLLTLTAGANGNTITFAENGSNRSMTMPGGGASNLATADVQTWISSYPDFAGGTVTAAGPKGGPWTLTFSGPTLGNQDIQDITFVSATGTVTGIVENTTQGTTLAPSTGAAAGTMVTTTNGNGLNNWVNIQTGTSRTEVIHGLAPNGCFDFYFNIEIVRDVKSWLWTRPYHILVQDCPGDVCAPILDFYSVPSTVPPTLGGSTDPYVNTLDHRQIYVEKILSQNRNYVAQSNGGSCPSCGLYYTTGFSDTDGPGGAAPTGTRVANNPTNTLLKVGSTYNFTLVAQTATGGYGSWSSQINWPRGMFQIMQVRTYLQQFPDPVNPTGCCYEDTAPYSLPDTYPTVPTPNPPTCTPDFNLGAFGCNGVIAQTWADAGAFCENAPFGGNTGCVSPATAVAAPGSTIAYRVLDPAAGAKDTAGNLVYITFTLRIVQIGSATTSAVVWDGSGSSYHYNSDYNVPKNFYTFCASLSGTSPLCDNDTAVSFNSANATRTPNGSVVRWTTGSETNNLGFNVYADNGGQKIKLNDEPIAGTALSDGYEAQGSAHTYKWVDTGAPADRYWIEALDLDGASQWHGPLEVHGWSADSPSDTSPPLSSLSPPDAPKSGGTVPRTATLAGSTVQSAPSAVAAGGVKIGIDREGWYRIPLATLAASGVNVANPNRLRLFAEAVEQPILIRDGAVEFYGLGLDTAQTGTRIYWLVPGAATGAKRIAKLPPSGGGTAPTSFMSSVERRDHGVYFAGMVNAEAPNFFGSVVGAAKVPQTLSVTHLTAGGSGATLDVALQGVTAGNHSVSVGLNGSRVGVVTFKGREERGVLSVPVGNLVEGTNTVTLSSPSWSDVSLAEATRITYPRSYVSDGGALRFTVPGGSAFSVTGFSAPGVRIVDVTDPAAPTEVSVGTAPDGTGGYAASSTAPGTGTRTLYAFLSGAGPASIVPTSASRSLATAPRTDMLMVTGSQLAPSAEPLANLHRSQGLATTTVPIDQVYDQFSYGEKDPQALKDFLAYAESHWANPPRYVLLIGDASLDPRGYLGPTGATADVIPTKMLSTHAGQFSSDGWFSDLNGDLRPDFALGRLPARTQVEADAMVSKIVSYSSGPKNGDSVIAAGAPHADDIFDFSAAAQEAANTTPPGGVGTVISSTGPGAKANLLSAMNAGPSVVGYFGHGNIDLWGGGFFSASDVPSLTNSDHPFFFTPMTCYNGYFIDPKLDSLSEALLKAKGGAVAAYASSGATGPDAQWPLAQGLYGYLASTPSPAIGDAVVAASAAVPNDAPTGREVLMTWTLLGDPAMRLR